MNLPTLYSRTTKGAVQEWTIEIGDGLPVYRTIHGQQNGKLITSEWFTCEATNVGRANERTNVEQAIFVAESLWKKKQEKKYSENLNDIDCREFQEPMLAKNWDDRKDKISFPLFCQPKLDGCLHGDSNIKLDGISINISDLYKRWLSSPTTEIPNIKTYNEITGENEYKPITAVFKNEIDIREKSYTWYKITTDNGKELTLTGNHRVWVDNLKCWRRVDELDGTETLKNSI